jgi:hypothetical protein
MLVAFLASEPMEILHSLSLEMIDRVPIQTLTRMKWTKVTGHGKSMTGFALHHRTLRETGNWLRERIPQTQDSPDRNTAWDLESSLKLTTHEDAMSRDTTARWQISEHQCLQKKSTRTPHNKCEWSDTESGRLNAGSDPATE